jgi:hypothetical protein
LQMGLEEVMEDVVQILMLTAAVRGFGSLESD